jgi:hypothetical protein
VNKNMSFAAPRGLHFHKIAHRNGTGIERADIAQGQGIIPIYFPTSTADFLIFRSVSAYFLPLLLLFSQI